jgi:hypothetical protein
MNLFKEILSVQIPIIQAPTSALAGPELAVGEVGVTLALLRISLVRLLRRWLTDKPLASKRQTQ